ncbi:MAG: TMEM175 family protein [Cyanobacteria bacterium P01_H01_bin.153]
MHKGRLEAFGDAIIAIIITIMVLEFRVPESPALSALLPIIPQFLAYVLSFLFLTIYWNNHHNLFHAVERVNGSVLWANLHLMFWLSLVPFTTAWLSEAGLYPAPVTFYGLVLLLAAVAHFILVRTLIALHGKQSRLVIAIRGNIKGKLSLGLYVIGLVLGLWMPILALVFYVLVAILWLIPDRRFEKVIRSPRQ